MKLEKYLDSLANGVEFNIYSLPKINRILKGFERRKLIVIGARPSEGKSAFGMQLAYDFSKKFKVMFISLEMTIEEAMFRILCHHQKIPNTQLYDGIRDESAIKDFYTFLNVEKRRLIVTEEIGKTWEEIEIIMKRVIENKPDVIFLDYIQCVMGSGKKSDVIEDYIKNFRKLAIENNICIFILSQINRANVSESKEPTMEGLKFTGVLEEHADKVILLHYPCKHSETASVNDFKVIIAKNKNGQTGYVNCRIKPEYYIFEENMVENKGTKTYQEPQESWTD